MLGLFTNCSQRFQSFINEKIVSKYNYMINTFGFNTLMVLFCVYWSQGFKSLCSLAITFYYKDIFHLEPADTQYIRTFSFIAWFIKPLYGLISDNISIAGYYRKSYLFIWGLVGILSMLSILLHNNLYLSIIAFVINEFSQAFCDVIADAVMVEKSRNDEAGSSALQTFSWTVLAIGGFLGSIFGGMLLETLSPRTIIALSAICPLLIIVSAYHLEENTNQLRDFYTQAQTLLEIVKKPQIIKPLLFILLLSGVTPRFSELFTYYMTDVLKFSTTFMGSLQVAAYISVVIGSWVYHIFLKNLEYRSIICIGQIVMMLINLFDLGLVTELYKYLGLPSWTFVLFGDILGGVVSFTFKSMPLLVMNAKICPVGIEGTFYALFTSVTNLSYSISGFFGGFLVEAFDIKTGNYELFWLLVCIQIFSQLIPLVFLKLLPKIGTEQEEVVDVELLDVDPEDDELKTHKI